MIKLGRMPGKLYSVEFEENMTVGQAITKARTLAEEQGKSLDVAGCQIRMAGTEVTESKAVEDNAIITISQKIKGNVDMLIYVEFRAITDEYVVNESTTALDVLKLVGADVDQYQLATINESPIEDDEYVLEQMSTSFLVIDRPEIFIEEFYEDENEDDAPVRGCCGGNCHSDNRQSRCYQGIELSNKDNTIRVSVNIDSSEDFETTVDIMEEIVEKVREQLNLE